MPTDLFPTLAQVPPGLSAPVPDGARGRKAAHEFEAQLIASLLESLEKTFSALSSTDPIAGSDDYNYLGTRALAEALASRGGFGIANLISAHLPSHEGKG